MVTTNARKDFPVFDCDSHVVEPPAIWDEYVPAREPRLGQDAVLLPHRQRPALHQRARRARRRASARTPPRSAGRAGTRRRSGKLTPGTAGMAAEVRPPARLPRPARAAQRHGRAGHRPGDAVPHVVRPPGARAQRRGGDGAGPGLQRLGARLLRRRPAAAVSRARCCRCRASRRRSPSSGASPSWASRRRRCAPASGTAAIPTLARVRSPVARVRGHRAWCWPCTPSPRARR